MQPYIDFHKHRGTHMLCQRQATCLFWVWFGTVFVGGLDAILTPHNFLPIPNTRKDESGIAMPLSSPQASHLIATSTTDFMSCHHVTDIVTFKSTGTVRLWCEILIHHPELPQRIKASILKTKLKCCQTHTCRDLPCVTLNVSVTCPTIS